MLGLFTRPVAFILVGGMAVAYFIAHAPRGFFPLLNAGELAIVYCFVLLSRGMQKIVTRDRGAASREAIAYHVSNALGF